MIYPSIDDAVDALAQVLSIGISSAESCVRDWGLLESALHRPQHAALYEDASLARQAATLLWGLVMNHPFVDGNKRTAFVLTEGLLQANGWAIQASEDDKLQMILSITEGVDLDTVDARISTRLGELPSES